MRCLNGRVLGRELMDTAPWEVARESLRDLVRVNRYLGGHRVLRALLRRVSASGEPFTLLDVGAASGDMGKLVRRVYPGSTVVSLDQQMWHLREAAPPRVAGDAFKLPFRDRSFDFVFSSLFLHHFGDEQVVALLAGFRRVARRAVLAIDLERHPAAYYFMPASQWALGWKEMTVHDGKLSVESAFRKAELARLAAAAGLANADVRQHRPWFRLSLVAPV